MHDIVIRDAMIVDGTGEAAYRGDIGVDAGVITEIVEPSAADSGRREIDADGLLVAPGWVDAPAMTTNWSLRSCAHAASSWPWAIGRSLP